jgi:hypothetical protein
MAKALRRIVVAPGSELARLLEIADAEPLILEKDGELYRLGREGTEDALWACYDPADVRSAIRKAVGSWADIDADALVADLYRAREEGSRPTSRP